MLVTLPGMVIEVKEEQQEFVALIDNLQVASNTVEKSWRCGGEGEKGKDLTSLTYLTYEYSPKTIEKALARCCVPMGYFSVCRRIGIGISFSFYVHILQSCFHYTHAMLILCRIYLT